MHVVTLTFNPNPSGNVFVNIRRKGEHIAKTSNINSLGPKSHIPASNEVKFGGAVFCEFFGIIPVPTLSVITAQLIGWYKQTDHQ